MNYFFEDEQKALEDTLQLNEMFVKLLPTKEAMKATESEAKVYKTKNKDYKYKNKTIANSLGIPLKTLKRHITYMKKSGLLA